MISTEQLGANQAATAPSRLVLFEEAFADTDFPKPPGPTPLWGPGAIPGEWTDVCGFIVLPNSHELWKVRLHGAFTMPREILGLSQRDQSCHHEVWLHWEFVGDRYAHGSRMNHDNRHDNRVLLMERSCPYPPTKEKGRYDDGSDHSLSSLSSARELMLP